MEELYNGLAIIVGSEQVNLNSFPNLRVIGCNMTSVEHLPLNEMKKRDIKLISLKGEIEFLKEISSTAEHTIGLVIALFRNYKTAFHEPYLDREAYRGHTLKGKTLGIIGYGRIGKQVAKIAKGLGMKILRFDNKEGTDYREDNSLIYLLRNSDIVSLHIPLQGNEGFFKRWMFDLMKKEDLKSVAYLINTSREGIVEEEALLWALKNKIIAGAAIDFVYNPDLLRYNRENDNLILTNHIGGCTKEDMKTTKDFIKKKVRKCIENAF